VPQRFIVSSIESLSEINSGESVEGVLNISERNFRRNRWEMREEQDFPAEPPGFPDVSLGSARRKQTARSRREGGGSAAAGIESAQVCR